VSDDSVQSSWIVLDPRVTSRRTFSLPEYMSLSTRFWPDVGATNEIKTSALFRRDVSPSASGIKEKPGPPASVTRKYMLKKGPT
jgi:hypothetical protein